jgi:hypothetical protein
MNRGFYSLPDPREVALRWRQFEREKGKISRVERRLQDVKRRRAEVEEQIKRLGDAEVTELARAILAGEDDPATRHDEHEKLVAELRELRRQAEALARALPAAEEELRRVVYENQHRWKSEADSALEKAIAEERKAYDRALQLIQEPRRRRIYAEALSGWIRSVSPTFGQPSDVAALSALQNLGAGAYIAEEKLEERRRQEQREDVA